MNWNGRVAVITGSSSGIGLETARALHGKGVKVVLAARRKDRIDALARQLDKSGTSALPVQTDVSSEPDVDRLFEHSLEKFGRIDWLINNAGSGLYASIEDTTPEQMDRLWRTNFMGSFYAIRKAIPIMKRQGEGHILTVSSMAGVRGTPKNGAYCATKFAQVGLMDSLRRELDEIHCTLILPGNTQTEFRDVMENPHQTQAPTHGAVQSAQDVAAAIIDAIEHPSARVITQEWGRMLLVLNALSPSFTDWLVTRTVTPRRKDQK
jgi:short-subunit dehydrogenase